jgi:hypothetical protein
MKPSIQFVRSLDGVKLTYTKFGKGPALVFPAPWVTSLSYVIEGPFARHFWERVAQVATALCYRSPPPQQRLGVPVTFKANSQRVCPQ